MISVSRKDDKLKLVVPCCVVVRTTPMTSGNFHWTLEDVSKSIVCIMSSPCQAGSTQMLNDWYDREIDAINEPYRPIPSVAISENEVITQIWVLLLGGLGLAGLLDVWAQGRAGQGRAGQGIALGRSFPSYIYSAQPLKVTPLTRPGMQV